MQSARARQIVCEKKQLAKQKTVEKQELVAYAKARRAAEISPAAEHSSTPPLSLHGASSRQPELPTASQKFYHARASQEANKAAPESDYSKLPKLISAGDGVW